MERDRLKQHHSNTALDAAYCFENKSYTPDKAHIGSASVQDRSPHTRTSHRRYNDETYVDQRAIEDMIIPHSEYLVNSSQGVPPVNRKRDFFSSMSVASEDFPTEVVNTDHRDLTKEPLSHSRHIPVTEQDQQPQYQYDMSSSKKNPREVHSSLYHTNQPQLHSEYGADYPQYSDRDIRYKDDPRDLDDVYPCFDEEVVPVPKETKPRRIHPLPSSRLRQSPLGGHYSPAHFEYSVFSQSCSASDDDDAEALTPYSSDQESIDSEFPQLSSAPESLKLRPVESISWDDIGQMQDLVKGMPNEVLQKSNKATSEVKAKEIPQTKDSEVLPVSKVDGKDCKSNASDVEKRTPRSKAGDVSGNDTYSGLSSLCESPITFSEKFLQTSTPRDKIETKVVQVDVKLQTEQEMSTQTDSEVGTQTDLAIPEAMIHAEPNVSKGVQSQTSFETSPKAIPPATIHAEPNVTKGVQSQTSFETSPKATPQAMIHAEPNVTKGVQSQTSFETSPKATPQATIHAEPNVTKGVQSRTSLETSPKAIPQAMIHAEPNVTKVVQSQTSFETSPKAIPQAMKHTQPNVTKVVQSQTSFETSPKIHTRTEQPLQPRDEIKEQEKPVADRSPVRPIPAKRTTIKPKESSDKSVVISSHPNFKTPSKARIIVQNQKPIPSKTPSATKGITVKYQRLESSESVSTVSSGSQSSGRILPQKPKHPEQFAPSRKKDVPDNESKNIQDIKKTQPKRMESKKHNQITQASPHSQTQVPSKDPWGYNYTPEKPKAVKRDYHLPYKSDEQSRTPQSSTSSTSSKRRVLPSEPDHPDRYSPDPFKRDISSRQQVNQSYKVPSNPQPPAQKPKQKKSPKEPSQFYKVPSNPQPPVQKPKQRKAPEEPSQFYKVPTNPQPPVQKPKQKKAPKEPSHPTVPPLQPAVAVPKSPKWKYVPLVNSEDSDARSDITVMEVSTKKTSPKTKSPSKQQDRASEQQVNVQMPQQRSNTYSVPKPSIPLHESLFLPKQQSKIENKILMNVPANASGIFAAKQNEPVITNYQNQNLSVSGHQQRSGRQKSSPVQPDISLNSRDPPPTERPQRSKIKTSFLETNVLPYPNTSEGKMISGRSRDSSPKRTVPTKHQASFGNSSPAQSGLASHHRVEPYMHKTADFPRYNPLMTTPSQIADVGTKQPARSYISGLEATPFERIVQTNIEPTSYPLRDPVTTAPISSHYNNYTASFGSQNIMSSRESKHNTTPSPISLAFSEMSKSTIPSPISVPGSGHQSQTYPGNQSSASTNVPQLNTSLTNLSLLSSSPTSVSTPISLSTTKRDNAPFHNHLPRNTENVNYQSYMSKPPLSYQPPSRVLSTKSSIMAPNSANIMQSNVMSQANTNLSKPSYTSPVLKPAPYSIQMASAVPSQASHHLLNTSQKPASPIFPGSQTTSVMNYKSPTVSGLSSSGSALPSSTDLSTGFQSPTTSVYLPIPINSNTKLSQPTKETAVRSSVGQPMYQQTSPKMLYQPQVKPTMQTPKPSTLTEVLQSRYPSEELSKRLSGTNPLPIQTIPERDSGELIHTRTSSSRSATPTKILVPGQRIKASYLNNYGQEVVILAPGIGENAPLGQPPRHALTGGPLPQQMMTTVGPKHSSKSRHSRTK